jgi:hypothetical protein
MNFDPASFALSINRRSFLTRSAYGLGGLALANLLGRESVGAIPAAGDDGKWRGIIQQPHYPIRAKRIIHLCMAGGPSQLETFDYKPELERLNGQAFPESFTKGQQLASCRAPN